MIEWRVLLAAGALLFALGFGAESRAYFAHYNAMRALSSLMPWRLHDRELWRARRRKSAKLIAVGCVLGFTTLVCFAVACVMAADWLILILS